MVIGLAQAAIEKGKFCVVVTLDVKNARIIFELNKQFTPSQRLST